MTAYSLASMLTFSQTGAPVQLRDVTHRVAHMIFAGQPERLTSRRDWGAWELRRLGHTAEAERLIELVNTRSGTRSSFSSP